MQIDWRYGMVTAVYGGYANVDGEKLRELRRSRFLSLRDLSRRCGVSIATLRSMEAGGQAQPRSVRRVADALGVDPSEFAEPAADEED